MDERAGTGAVILARHRRILFLFLSVPLVFGGALEASSTQSHKLCDLIIISGGKLQKSTRPLCYHSMKRLAVAITVNDSCP